MAAELIRNISDTARWVAFYRAMESERPDALFHDRWARQLAGERGEAIARAMPRGISSGWTMAVRTAVMDEIILRQVAGGAAAVLNLACGLDTRPYRLPLPAALRWIEVDLPGILDAKEEVLAGEQPVCALERVRLDLADRAARRALFARVAGGGGPVLVVSEGLLVYLPAEQVAELARDLAASPRFRWWLADLVSPLILKMLRRSWGPALAAAGAPMQFAPEAGPDFFRPFGWQAAEMLPFAIEARRLHREMPRAGLRGLLLRLLPGIRRAMAGTGILLLARLDEPPPR
jgi:methyltransferase (TIGR00027 family)